MQDVAVQALTMEEVRNGFPALWAHLQECEECLTAFAQLLRVAHAEGHREGQSEEAALRRTVALTALAGVLAVVLLAGGFFVWQYQTQDAVANRIYERMGPAVANIQVKSAGVTGSGVVFDADGYLITNYHVIQDARSHADIMVQLPNLGEVPSRLIGYDVATDLAVLKVDVPPERLTAASFGNSVQVKVGELAIAIGNPFGLSHSLTVGHISAVARRFISDDMYAPDVEGVLQTDAAINPGNSGGPLFNSSGQVIGINTRIESPSGGSVGLGFATPSNTVLQVAREIIARGYVRRPFLGAGGRPIDATLAQDLHLPVDQGLLVQEIYPDSPASKIGLDAGNGSIKTTNGAVKGGADVILSINGQQIETQSDLNRLVAQSDVGDTVEITILRDGKRRELSVVLAERPSNPMGGAEASFAPAIQ